MEAVCLILVTAPISLVTGHLQFQKLIPNGDRIPHPCGGGQIWQGVGHVQPGGGGRRNQFGLDFKNSSMRWSELCRKDSDGDGRTNGEELGDPGCTWVTGSVPATSSGLSHPGICEPVTSQRCKAYNEQFGMELPCDTRMAECPGIREQGTLQKAVRFPVTRIPPEATNYFCMLFDLPSDGDYHLVATTPITNNSTSLHHMILFGCQLPDKGDERKAVDANKNRPYRCGMSPHKHCQQLIGTWTVGSQGDCVSENTGFHIGNGGYKVAALQVHWNNPLLRSDMAETPGMTLYYTARRRQYDAGMFLVGQEYLAIPPRARDVVFESRCPSECTEQMFKQDVFITRAVNHMHYLGQSQVVTVYRDGKKLRELTNDQNYNYDNPVFYHYDPPVVIQPGDEIRTRCVYSSNNKSQVTYFGAGTNDEMCYAFITYFPTHHLPPTLCASWKGVQRCHRYLEKFGGMLGDCRWRALVNPEDQENKRIIAQYYAPDSCGSFVKSEQCSDNCTKASRKLAKHACLQGEVGQWAMYKLRTSPKGQVFLNTLKKCGAFANQAAFVRVGTWLVTISVLSVWIHTRTFLTAH